MRHKITCQWQCRQNKCHRQDNKENKFSGQALHGKSFQDLSNGNNSTLKIGISSLKKYQQKSADKQEKEK